MSFLCLTLIKSSWLNSGLELTTLTVMETLDSAELLMGDQAWLDYLWDFETRGINLDFSSMLLSPGPDTD